MQDQLVSVIIPTYNEVNSICILLEHLMNFSNIEVIVSDGGSSDGTVNLCNNYPIILVNSSLGRGNQLNAGIKRAKGDILLFLHADSDFADTILDDIRGAIKSGSKWGCCSLAFNDKSLSYKILAFSSNIRAKIFSSCYGDQGIFCEANFIKSIGGFPEVPFLEDISFSNKIKQQYKAKVVKSKIVTSPRRFKRDGLYKTLLKMQIIKLLFQWGISPEKLIKLYR